MRGAAMQVLYLFLRCFQRSDACAVCFSAVEHRARVFVHRGLSYERLLGLLHIIINDIDLLLATLIIIIYLSELNHLFGFFVGV